MTNTTAARVHVGDAPVDSGQMAISSDLSWDDDATYAQVCEAHDDSGGLFRDGVVSSTGWGDGCYPVYLLERRGEAVGVEVDFLLEDEGRLHPLGTVTVTGGSVSVADPCYDGYGRTEVPLPDGEYDAAVHIVPEGKYHRVSRLGIYAKEG
jgi:hypothetical protein